MAPKAMKRALSKPKIGGRVKKQCKSVAAAIRQSEEIPAPVRSMLADNLARTFATYKADRHEYQNSASSLVNTILTTAQGKLQAEIDAAQGAKTAGEAEVATLAATATAADEASKAAEAKLAEGKTKVNECKTALKDAKAALSKLESDVKTGTSDFQAATSKKAKIEAVTPEYLTPIKEGTKSGAAAGRHVTSVLSSSLEPEFVTCVTRTFSKTSSEWGTFDKIVDERLAGMVVKVVAGLTAEIAAIEAAQGERNASIETAKAAITTAEENAKAADEACAAAGAAAKEAEATAKAASSALKTGEQQVHKAAQVLAHAEDALKSFSNGAMKDYNELEARKAPEPKPVPEEPTAPTADAAMAPAPSQPAPTMASSPTIRGMVESVRNFVSSPRVAQTPQVAPSGSASVAASPRQPSSM